MTQTIVVIRVERILGTNRKLAKTAGPAGSYLATGITLAPGNLSGHEVCRWRSRGCFGACVMHYAGQRRHTQSRARAIRLTQWLFADRPSFEAQLREDIELHIKRATKESRIPAIRLNAASDLDWTHIVSMYPETQFFDYTKSAARMKRYLAGELPANYALTFSASEKTPASVLRGILDEGGNVARVFTVPYCPQHDIYGDLPKTMTIDGKRFRVIDGDTHDIRIPSIDGRGRIVGLRLKGTNASKDRAVRFGFSVSK
jgi:hypothetical protein